MNREDLLTISQVSKIVNVAPSVLRFWEKEFNGFLSPFRTTGNQRRYKKKDIDTILMIKELLKKNKFKIEGAREVLAQKVWLLKLDNEFGKLIGSISKKLEKSQELTDQEMILLILKHIVRDTAYKADFRPEEYYYTSEVYTSGGLILRDIKKEQFKKALLIGFGQIGDTVWVKPFLETLKKIFPEVEVSILVWDVARGLFAGHPFIRTEFVLEKIRMAEDLVGKKKWPSEIYTELQDFIQRLRNEKFDIIINLKRIPMAAIFTYLIRVPVVYGEIINNRGNILMVGNIWEVLLQGDSFERLRWIGLHRAEQLLRLIGIEQLDESVVTDKIIPWGNNDYWHEETVKDRFNIKGDDFIVGVQVGARMETKRWGTEKTAQLIEKLIANMDAKVFILGSEKEKGLAREIRDRVKSPYVIDLVGKIDLSDIVIFLKQCDFLISPDTGPKHIAISVGTSVIEISTGEDSFYRVGPYGPESIILRADLDCDECKCDKCAHKKCIEMIGVDAVFYAILIHQRLKVIDFKDITEAPALVHDLVVHPSLKGINIYYSGKDMPGKGFTYFPLRENKSVEKAAVRILNYCYVKLWEDKNIRLFDNHSDGLRQVKIDERYLIRLLGVCPFNSKDQIIRRLSMYIKELGECQKLAEESIEIIKAIYTQKTRHERIPLIRKLKVEILPELFDRTDTASLISTVNWKITQRKVLSNLLQEDMLGEKKDRDMLKFPKYVYEDCKILRRYLKECKRILKAEMRGQTNENNSHYTSQRGQ